MNDTQEAAFVESLSSLQDRHQQLVALSKSFEEKKEKPNADVISQIENFVIQGRQVGAVLDLKKDRMAAQSLLDYWASTYYRTQHNQLDSTLADFDYKKQLEKRGAEWARSGFLRKFATLLTNAELPAAKRLIEGQPVSKQVSTFVFASNCKALATYIAVAVFVIGVTAFAYWQYHERAVERSINMRVSHSRDLANESEREPDPARARRLALEAYKTASTEQAEQALRKAVQIPLPKTVATFKRWAQSVAFNPDGTMLAAGGWDNNAVILSADDFDRPVPKIKPSVTKEHPGPVVALTFYHDDHDKNLDKLATASGTKGWIWDARNLDTGPKALDGHQDSVTSIAFSPNGKQVATGSYDGTARLWDAQTGKAIQTFSAPGSEIGLTFGVSAVVFSKDNVLLTGSRDGTITVWDVEKPKSPLSVIYPGLGPISGLAFAENWGGVQLLAVSGTAAVVKVFDLASNRELMQFSGGFGQVCAIALDDAGTLLGMAIRNEVKIWNLERQTEALTLHGQGEDAAFTNLALSADGERVATTSTDGTVRLWPISQVEPQFSVNAHKEGQVYGLSFSADGRTLATATANDSIDAMQPDDTNKPKKAATFAPISLWTGEKAWEISRPGPRVGVWRLAISPDSKQLAAGNNNGTIELLDIQNPEKPISLTTREVSKGAVVYAVTYAPKPNHMFAAGASDGTITLWDSTDSQWWTRKPISFKHERGVLDLAFSPDGGTLASAGTDWNVRLWHVQDIRGKGDPKPFCTLEWHTDVVRIVSFRENGDSLVTAGADGTVRLWSLPPNGCPNSRLLRNKKSDTRPDRVSGIASWTGGGHKYLATLGKDGTIKILDLPSKLDISFVRSGVSRIAVRPDGEVIAVTSDDGWLNVYPIGAKALYDFVNNQLVNLPKEVQQKEDKDPQNWYEEKWSKARERLRQFRSDVRSLKTAKDAARMVGTLEEIHRDFPTFPISADDWNRLCWQGSIAKQAVRDLLFACDAAVMLVPSRYYFRDARGIALARRDTPDRREAAILDFRLFLSAEENTEYAQKRNAWIQSLRRGEKPFTPKVLEELEKEH